MKNKELKYNKNLQRMGDEIIKDIVTKSLEYQIAFQLLNEYSVDAVEISRNKPIVWAEVVEIAKHYTKQYYPDVNVQDLGDPVEVGDEESIL